MKIESIQDLEQIIAERDLTIERLVTIVAGLGELTQGMDARIRALSLLFDRDHQILIDHGWAAPYPKTGQS